MTREDVIRLSYAVSNGNLNNSDVCMLLLSYCLENGKPYMESAAFVSYLSRIPLLLSYCISYALRWYKIKYAIHELYSAPNPKVVNNKRRIILIY